MKAAGEVAFEAAHRLAVALALGTLAGQVGTGLGVKSRSSQRDHVQGVVELAIATAVQAMALCLARRGRDRRDA